MVNCNVAKKAMTYTHIEQTSEQFKTMHVAQVVMMMMMMMMMMIIIIIIIIINN